MTTQEKNELIARFMGYELITPTMRRNPSIWTDSYWEHRTIKGIGKVLGKEGTLYYNTSWSQLMPVVEDIMNRGFIVEINSYGTKISRITTEGQEFISERYINTQKINRIETTFEAVVDFLMWRQNNSTVRG